MDYITQLEAAENNVLHAVEMTLRNKMGTLRVEKMLDNLESSTTLVSHSHMSGQRSSDLWWCKS